jgi:hypothetical protein
VTGEYQKITVKGLKKNQMYKKYEKYHKAVTGLERTFRRFMYELFNWCDYNSIYSGTKAARRDNAREKLSDSASWRSGI